MALENLRQNVEQEREILKEIFIFSSQRARAQEKDREILSKAIDSLTELLKIINNSVPSLVENILPVKKLGKIEKVKELVSLSYEKEGLKKRITINEAERKKFLKELSLSEFAIKRLKKGQKAEKVIFKEFKKPSFYAKISNRFFSKFSNKLIEKGYFNNLDLNLRKANMPFLLNTYVSMMFFSTLLACLFALFLFVFLIFFTFSLNFPFLAYNLTNQRLVSNIFISLAVPVLAFFAFYFYPYTEKQSMGKKIDQELPFVAIYMSAIAGSGIEPSQIFKIIALGKEYPHTKQEIKKIINQVNVYGYDLVNSLKNTARTTSSNKLAELFNGLATTISSGGSLTEFLDKRAETLLFDYKLEREKATKVAETFMDIYISVVIAAPMIMMLLLILISVSRMNIGLSLSALTAIIVSIVAFINIVFLIFLQLKQTSY